MRRNAYAVHVSVSAAALALGALLTGCGGDRDGYVASGAAGSGISRADGAVPPTGHVEYVPLDPGGTPASGRPTGPAPSATGATSALRHSGSPGSGTGTDTDPATGADRAAPGPSASSRAPRPAPPAAPVKPSKPSTPSGPSAPGSGKATPPGSPAALTVGAPRRAPAGDRWCENVTVSFTNTGGRPVTGGLVVLGTHIVDLFGTDWATLPSVQPLPAPIDAGRTAEKTWTVCVDPWRVPLGTHIETRDAWADWT
ncbi:hypothetical protein AB0K09_08575 [Streptomyces sp. NPDC049577]|uniref:hypothetical protein n=1 Tax=Streptomyces sp. NPDC049577 TaxID=3155153 RepID=UPI003423AB2F